MLIDLNKELTRGEYLDLHFKLKQQQKLAYDCFIDAIPFNQYHKMTHCGIKACYSNCVVRISKVSKSKKLHALALAADISYELLRAFEQSYPAGCAA